MDGSTPAFATSPLLTLTEGPLPAIGPAELAVAPAALIAAAGSSRDEVMLAGSAAFFASAALVAATPPIGVGLDRTFFFDLQEIDVSSLPTR
jgi:hypothetical protein